MQMGFRIHTKVLSGHRIEISAPQLSEGASVDVFVMPTEQPARPMAGRREILRMPVEQRRQLLMQQSEDLASYYESDADRCDWQGGDIVE